MASRPDAPRVLYSAKDLLTFLGCEHATALDLAVRTGSARAPDEVADPYLDLLREKGDAHERRHLDTLRAEGRTIVEITRTDDLDEMAERTRQAMRDGVDVIYQGALVGANWYGYSDFLLRVDRPSRLGAHSYEVADTKLARTAKPKHVFQLCVYSHLVALEQEVTPERMHVVLGDGASVALKLDDFVHYVDAARERFGAFTATRERRTEAVRCGHCEMCRWRERCDDEWEARDDLRLVARLTATQAERLTAAGVGNLRALAALDERAIPRLHADTVDRLRAQARLQLVNRTTGEHRVEVLPLEAGKGFARLPRPDAGDLFFDMEGDPVYAADGSLEYLFGFHHVDGGVERFTAFWAHDRASEKKAFEDALDFITARLRDHPNAYIYHYASYEETALKRLAQQYGTAPKQQVDALKRLAQTYGTRENEVDDLLRKRKLVDLYKVVREGIRISQPSYSLKALEVFFADARTQEIKAGGDSVVAFERWLAVRDDAILKQIEEYNAFDCRSTMQCRDWLLRLRPDDAVWFDPKQDSTEREAEFEAKRRARDADILALRGALVYGAPEHELEWRVLLGHLLEYHRREARREWWEYFKRLEARVEELIDDSECLGGLTVDQNVQPRKEKRSTVWTLRFPDQDTKLRAGHKVVRADTEETLEIVAFDDAHGRLELKVGPTRKPLDGIFSLIPGKPLDDNVQRDAIARYAQAVVAGCAAEYPAITSVLRRELPRLVGDVILRPGAELSSGAVDAITRMDGTHLVVQGPPGCGKTYTSAHAIVELLARGKRVGVTALSHKAINKLLGDVESVALERGVAFRGAKKSSDKDEDQAFHGKFIQNTTNNDDATGGGHALIAGTAWLFARPELDRALDYLFVDEAGQMSLANVVATGGSARNIVLVGDQMQLSQPTKGAHPGGSGVSALDHLMQHHATVPPDRGILLARTWRMHPDVCRFVSLAFYDGRLEPAEVTVRQKLILSDDANGVLAPTGLRFVEVPHDDNGQRSEEEAERLAEAYRALIGQQWVNQKGEIREITAHDILVVSPYNMQVHQLEDVLPASARVGTVDRFQGQEAAVVLISLASSSGEHIPRGIEFLFSPNRLNVAISRARCLSVVFASPRLLATTCRSVEQVRLVNTLCRMKAVVDNLRQPACGRTSTRARC